MVQQKYMRRGHIVEQPAVLQMLMKAERSCLAVCQDRIVRPAQLQSAWVLSHLSLNVNTDSRAYVDTELDVAVAEALAACHTHKSHSETIAAFELTVLLEVLEVVRLSANVVEVPLRMVDLVHNTAVYHLV